MRWKVLAALTVARMAMGVQFQSVAAVGDALRMEAGLGHAALGALIGLYLLPGIALAIPGGWIGRRIGDAPALALGLALMVAGGAAAAMDALWTGRALAGIGAVLLNVLATKTVADWFAPREMPLAMGILITSWPAGLGLALVALPAVSAATGTAAALWAATAVAAAALGLTLAFVRSRPPGDGAGAGPAIDRAGVLRASLAGLVWAFYNAGFILVMAFAPAMLVSFGETPVAAAAGVSLVGWLIIPSLAAGGWIVSRVAAPDRLTTMCLVGAGALVLALPVTGGALWPFVLIGLLLGPPGPLIMTLPAVAVPVAMRSVAFAVYFTWYYVAMALAPVAAGWLLDTSDQPAAPMALASACLLAACFSLVAFRRSLR